MFIRLSLVVHIAIDAVLVLLIDSQAYQRLPPCSMWAELCIRSLVLLKSFARLSIVFFYRR